MCKLSMVFIRRKPKIIVDVRSMGQSTGRRRYLYMDNLLLLLKKTRRQIGEGQNGEKEIYENGTSKTRLRNTLAINRTGAHIWVTNQWRDGQKQDQI